MSDKLSLTFFLIKFIPKFYEYFLSRVLRETKNIHLKNLGEKMINKNLLEKINVDITELQNIHSLLLKTNYELIEIWTSDFGNEVQIWSNKKLKKLINITITKDNTTDNNTTKIVNELIDLWLELRAIRNALEYDDEEYTYKTIKEPSASEKYYSKLKELEEEWNDNENYMSKIFKENIDPSVLAYLHLEDDIKLLLTN